MSKQNPGKIFEEDFKNSVPKTAYYLRLHDSAIGFDIEKSTQRFSLQSPYDCIICNHGQMWCFELKSTKEAYIAFKGKTPKIKIRQINELIKAKTAGAKSYLVINFRTYEKTFLIDPDDFMDFVDNTDKKSINIDEAEKIGIPLKSEKKRVRDRYDITGIIEGTI